MRYLAQLMIESSEAGKRLSIVRRVLAPGDLVLDRDLFETGARSSLFARMQAAFVAVMLELYIAFDNRNASAFGSMIHRKHRAGNSDIRIAGIDKQMLVLLFGGLH